MKASLRVFSSRRFALIAGISIAALTAAPPAAAQCVPDPTVLNGTTTCSGTDSDGLVVTSSGTVAVTAGATVLKGPANAGAIALSSTPASLTLVNLQNDGTIHANGGTALVALANPGRTAFSSITNSANGTISGSNGAMNVWFGNLTNAGTIDGGGGRAIALPGGGGVVFPSAIANSGSIVSNSTTATIDLTASTPQQFSNSGKIVNAGAGLAIDGGSRSLGLVNTAGGVVSSAGPVAIGSTFQVTLVNAGTINGGIVGGSGFDDRIDTRSGVINGSIAFNGGNDRLITAIGEVGLVGNINGSIDGGTGTDVLELIVAQDRVLTNTTLPTNFEVLQLDLTNNATLTLAAQPPAGGYHVRGTGTVVVGADLSSASGPAISGSYVRENLGFEALRFVNDRAITATLTVPFEAAVNLSVSSATNSGTITAINGNGIAFTSETSETVVSNSGTIIATNTGAVISGIFQNSGTIRSLTGAGVSNDLGGGGVRSRTSTNSGVIEGVTTGYGLSSLVLVNSGSIAASNGVGLAMSGASLDNQAGGVISGTQTAIRSDGFFENYVANAGTINGSIDFGSASAWSSAQDWFIDRGGTVNGDVRMGGGDDVFVADLSRPSGGVTGAIDGGAGFDTFRYRTSVDAQVIIVPRATFESVGYEVAGGARLTLTSPSAIAVPLSFAGTGTIDMTADLAGADRPLINASTGNLPSYSGLGPNLPAGALTIISRGTLTYGGGAGGILAIVQGSATSNFENAGTITTGATPYVAIRNWNMVTNSGTIVLNGNQAVTGAASFANTGTIRTAAGAATSSGISDVVAITNSGTMSVIETAISMPYAGSVRNSGLIASTGTAAIIGNGTVDNLSSGTISGNAATGAIRMSGGVLNNAGTITGSVDLGYDSWGRAFTSGTYIADGGTIAGDLRFGSGDDRLVVAGASLGVSGTIDGGAGTDRVVLGGTGNGIFAGAVNFEELEIASGNWTLTGNQRYAGGLTVAAGRLRLAGALPSAVTVGSGGTLGGNGTIASLTVASGGVVAPGDSPGTINVTGNLVQAAGSIYQAETTAAGLSDLIVVGGAATIASGAQLQITRDTGTYAIGTRYALLTAAGGINGSYSVVQTAVNGTEFRIVQTATSLFADLARTAASLSSVAITRNQTSVAAALAPLGTGNAAFAALTLLPEDGAVRRGLDDLSGEVHPSLRTSALADARLTQDAVVARLLTRDEGSGMWGQFMGRAGSDNGVAGAANVERNGWSGVGGADVELGSARIGVAGSYTNTDLRIAERASTAKLETTQALAYAGGDFGGIVGRAGIGYAWARNEVNRSVRFAGFADSLSADYDANVLHGFAEIEAHQRLLGGMVAPFAGVQMFRIESDAFAERGGAAALAGAARSQRFTYSTLGLRGETPVVDGLRARTSVAWRHLFGSEQPNADLRFVGNSTPFSVTGGALAGDTAAVSLDLAWTPSRNISVLAGYNGAIGDRSDDSTLRVGLAIGF